MTLTILAQITARPGHEVQVLDALQRLIPPTLNETGCLLYDLHTDNNRPDVFVFYETWQSRADWLAHNASAHIAAHKAATADMILSVEVNELTKLD